VVSVDRLIDAVWGDDVPGSATAGLQAYVSNLRRALRDGTGSAQMASAIVRQSPGYYLDVAPDDADYAAFAAGCTKAAAAVESADWADALAEADAGGRARRGDATGMPGQQDHCAAGPRPGSCGARRRGPPS
jgi:DNA-binding SARP family transcriptional activator